MRSFSNLLVFYRVAGLLVAAAILAAPAVFAIDVTAEGIAAILNNNMAGAEKQALRNAQRNAVEQGLGVVLDSKSRTENFKLIQDRVLTASEGFVTKFNVLSKGPTPNGKNYRVKIKATVSRNLLKDRLSALRILHQSTGQKKVMVIYQSENPNALERKHGANRTALQTIRNALNREGFRVFNQGETQKVYTQIERAARVDRPVEDIIAMALDQQANLLVRYENIAGKRGPKGGLFSAAFATIRISVFETSNGRQVADAQAEGKHLLRANPGPYDWEKGLAEAALKASRQAIKEVIDRIAVYYRQLEQEGFKYTVSFRNFNDEEMDKIVDYLESNPNFTNLTNPKFTGKFMEVVITSTQSSLGVQRLLRTGLKEKGIVLQRKFAEGYNIVFSNPQRPD